MYVNRIKQVAILLNYDEPQILELFKNAIPSRLYWVLFSINNLREAVGVTKRELTTEKIDRQLSGHSGTTAPFLKVGDIHYSKRKTASFNTQDLIREQLDTLISMVYNMFIQKEGNNLSPKYIKREREAKTEKFQRQGQK